MVSKEFGCVIKSKINRAICGFEEKESGLILGIAGSLMIGGAFISKNEDLSKSLEFPLSNSDEDFAIRFQSKYSSVRL